MIALVLIAAVLLIGLTPIGNQFAADQIASRISTPDMQVRIEGARGLLAGELRVDRVELADTEGRYAELRDVALDWSPLDLLGAEFHARRLAAASVAVDRQPVVTLEPEPSSSDGSFNLPVEIAIDQLDLPSIKHGQPLLGRKAELALKGSARAAADIVAVQLDAHQADRPAARAVADLAYAVNANTLKLDLRVVEPEGGLLASALQLPDRPAVDITVTGDGALSDWAGVIRARLDGVERLAVNASHQRNSAGMHEVNLNGGGAIGDLMPPTLRPLFDGESAIDIDASFDAAGNLDIRSGKLSNGSLTLDASGKVDPEGQVDLNGSLRSVGAVIPVRWPLSQGELQADLRNASFVASGPYDSVTSSVSADIATLALPQVGLHDVFMRLETESFSLASRAGMAVVDLSAQRVSTNDPQLARLVSGPIEITAPLDISEGRVASQTIEISSGAVGGKLTLDYGLQAGSLSSDFQLFLASARVLPGELATKLSDTIELSGQLSGTPGNLAFNQVKLASNVLNAEASGTLKGDELTVSVAGDVTELSTFQPRIDGQLHFTADLSGPLSALAAKVGVRSEQIQAAGRELRSAELTFDGILDPARPKGRLALAAVLNGQQIRAAADVVREDGQIRLPAITADIGRNQASGSLTLGSDLLPTGTINADLAELSVLAGLAGQQAEGDLKLTIDLEARNGGLAATIDGTGTRIVSGNTMLSQPIIHVESANLLAQSLNGTIRTTEITSGANRLETLELAFDHEPGRTTFDARSRYDDAPLTAKGAIDQQPESTVITVTELTAAPRKIPLALSAPARVTITNGTTRVEALTVAAGTGTIDVRGTIAETLDLTVAAEALPAGLANALSPDLGASGTLSGSARITGNAASPVIAFDASATDLTVNALSNAARSPVKIEAKGTFADALLSATATVDGVRELGTATIDTDVRLGDEIRIERLALASEALNGSLTGSFTPATQALAAVFDLNVTGERLIPPDILAKLDGSLRLTGRIDGTPDDLTFSQIDLASNLANAEASGKLKSGTLQATVTGTLPDLSALQPNISGAARFAAELTGPISAIGIKAQLSSAEAVLAGRPLANLAVDLEGVIDPASPTAKLTATGTIDGQPIDVMGELVTREGLISIPALAAEIGPNRLNAELAFDQAFRPSGNITFNLPDIGLLAALAGQQASGDLTGQAEISAEDGGISASINASGSGIAAQGLTIRNPAVDLGMPDLLALRISGTVKAAELAVANNSLADLNADFSLDGDRTDFSVNGVLDAAPLTATGTVDRTAGGMVISLAELSASPRKLPITLTAPATISVAGGRTDLGDVALAIGAGRLNLSGAVADTLDVSVAASDLPASLVNTFVPDLGATGTISATARITGTSSAPSITFDVTGQGLATIQVSEAGVGPLDIRSTGRFADGLLSADTTIRGVEQVGEARLLTEVTLDADRISVRKFELESERLDGTLTANYQPDQERLGGEFRISAVAAGLLPPAVSSKIEGPIALSGKIAGTLPDDLAVTDLRLSSDVLDAQGSATLKNKNLQAQLTGEITRLGAFHPDASGTARFSAEAKGPFAALDVTATLSASEAVLAGRPLQKLELKIEGVADPAKPSGSVTASGTLDNQPIDISAVLVTEQGRVVIPAIKVDAGRNSLTGSVQFTEDYRPSGSLRFDFPDIGLLAALAGQKASGDLAGRIELTEADGKIAADLEATGKGIIAQGVTIRNPAIDLAIPDLMSGQVSGTAKASELASGENRLADLDARFALAGNRTDFDIEGRFDGAPLTAKGTVENKPGGPSLTVAEFAATPRKIPVRLSSPVTINLANGAAEITDLAITTGQGTVTINGTAGESLNLEIKVTALPASLANTFASGLDAGGTISATAKVGGTSANPVVTFDLDWRNALISQIRAAGIPALNVNAKGKLENAVLSIDTDVSGGGGLTLTARGTVGTSGARTLNLAVTGQLPFSAIAAQLAEQGLALQGNANIDFRIGGNAASPQISGRITTAGSQFIAIRQNLIVNNLAATVSITGNTATISNLSGRLEGGGRISASGTIGITPGSGFPANLKIALDNAVYADGRVVVAKLDGDLDITGPLVGGPTLGGTIRLRRADITVPERLPASLANANVKHENAPADVLKQAREIRADTKASADEDKAEGLKLDLRIIAPRQIFVRGRGLDAELGGRVRISGSTGAPEVTGGFEMRRGRLTIIGKRLDFTTGEITFGGGLVPALNMVASTTVNATTLNVNVTGLANDPSFTFTSSPALPQDEVLAQLIFGRDSSSLSPFQIAQLADAVATLSGGQRTSLFNKLRQGLGIDDLNVGTDENGGAQVTAGKYINRRTYLEVMQGEDPSKSGVAINLDIGKGLKLRGQATQDGGTSTGIFYEKEY